MSDAALARAYWGSHVSRRRSAMVALLQAGIDRGDLRADIDIDACIDLINGVLYYQVVVRGASLSDADVVARCREGIRVAWRGMARI
ncbi:transcriptional repressor C-terminal [Sanguibacter gelidistatuariae]|uniref:Transcriptional repressor C-terminal n=1 Tax=Sanguibacter gelidistatuariae TaxID=1814289 RepID=A0A1G6RP37_9MICO|nr:TetR-like C-terminal domain-containing protein [Sanguibacter gelidistatuariae]SDD06422.1 transcriptional repressor C-terminal [Sanguibacter gelidistatuariae]